MKEGRKRRPEEGSWEVGEVRKKGKQKKEEKKNGFLIKLRNLEVMPFPSALAPFLGRFLSMTEGLPMVPESLVEGMTSFSRVLNESSKVESHWLH